MISTRLLDRLRISEGVTYSPGVRVFGSNVAPNQGYVYAETEQLLNESPNLGAIRGNFLRDFCATDDYGGVLHHQANNAAKASVGGLLAGRRVGPRLGFTNCCSALDAGIMRESLENNNHVVCSFIRRCHPEHSRFQAQRGISSLTDV